MNLPKELEKYILLYLYDELSEAEKKEFETHIQFNETSRKRVGEMREFHGLLNERVQLTPTESLLQPRRLQ